MSKHRNKSDNVNIKGAINKNGHVRRFHFYYEIKPIISRILILPLFQLTEQNEMQ